MMMNMEALEEVAASNGHTHIVKGKRTKRQRPLSPLGISLSTSSSTGGESSGGGGEFEHIIQFPTTSAESTEEEEDMANCLILLAQGHSLGSPKRIEEGNKIMDRFSSPRLAEAATTITTTGKAGGIYVYECKTCNRCFPSFQALGGHRASHKKPKAMVEEKKALVLYAGEGERAGEEGGQFINKINSPSLPLHVGNRPLYSNTKSRVHECSICGSEFSSGQALGGHMRRHRTSSTVTNTSMTMMNSLTSSSEPHQEPKKPRNILSLDLNLPAPEDDHRESKFPFSSKQQPLLFSSSALVDCHY